MRQCLPILALTALPAPVLAEAARIDLPSGMSVVWEETLQDANGPKGLTYRFRFSAPDLGERLGQAAPQPAPIEQMAQIGEGQDELIDPEDLDLAPVPAAPGDEEAADAAIEAAIDGGTDALPQGGDAVTRDMQFLCESFALPRVPNAGPRPQQIVISLGETADAAPSPDRLQIFEAFDVPAGENRCIWDPF